MSEVRAFFRFCPSCGRRFHIKLVRKDFVGERKEEVEMKKATLAANPGLGYSRYQYGVGPVAVLEENVPVVIDVREFQYTYKCKHCGHSWTESHSEESNE